MAYKARTFKRGRSSADVHASLIRARLSSVGEAAATDADQGTTGEIDFTGVIKLLQPVKQRLKSNMGDAVKFVIAK